MIATDILRVKAVAISCYAPYIRMMVEIVEGYAAGRGS